MAELKYALSGRFIIDIDKDGYEREKVLESGVKLYLDPTYRPTWYAKTSGGVVATPKKSKVIKGDTLYFHYTAVEVPGAIEWLEDGLYLTVENDFAWFYQRGDDVECLNGRCAVVPHQPEQTDLGGGIMSMEKPLSRTQGTVLYHDDKELIGQKVFFHRRNAFINEINGQKVYVMFQNNIEGTLDEWLEE